MGVGDRPSPTFFMPPNISLGKVQVALTADGPAISEGWDILFNTWPDTGADRRTTVALHLRQATHLPPLPAGPPIFVDEQGIVNVYVPRPGRFVLHFLDGALVTVDPDAGRGEGVVTGAALHRERLEDVTYTSLAPLLRQHEHFLLHAFAATWQDAALLLVGPSGSGKTTAGLSLVLAGWGLLANDVVLLHRQDERIHAYPTPGALSVRPGTLELLPRLRGYKGRHNPRLNSYTYTTPDLGVKSWAAPAPVRALCFPSVTTASHSVLRRERAAITFAHLLEESVDHWHAAALASHLSLLEQLSEQAPGYRVALGADVPHLPLLLAQVLASTSSQPEPR